MGPGGDQAPSQKTAQSVRHRALRSPLPRPSAGGQVDERLIYLGDDADGLALEVMAVELGPDELYVIHAMPLRKQYRAQYEQAKRWHV